MPRYLLKFTDIFGTNTTSHEDFEEARNIVLAFVSAGYCKNATITDIETGLVLVRQNIAEPE